MLNNWEIIFMQQILKKALLSNRSAYFIIQLTEIAFYNTVVL